jgi:Ca2+-binding EF-hand superfamily protein
MTEVVSVLTIDARGAEAGSAAYVRAMRAAQAAADRAIDVDRKATEARERGGLALVRQSETIARSAQAWDRLRASVDPHVAAQKAIEQAQLRADAALRRGVTTQEEAARVLALVRKRYAETTTAVNDNSAAMGQLQRQGGLARHELINLGRQAQDVAVSLASGQSPFTVLAQQGSQIADVFATSEGTIGGFFRQLGAGLVRVLPLAAAASAALVGVYSAVSVAGERQQLDNSLLGSGRGVGLSGGQFDALARESAEAAQITVSNARLIAAEYTRLGQLAATQLPRVTKVTKDYALVTGQDMTAAAKELARALADPSRGAELLADKVGHLDTTTLRSIRTAESYGDKLRAQKLLVDGLAQSLDGAANAQSKWDRFVEQFWSRPVDRAKNTIAEKILGPDPVDEIARIDRQLKDLRQSAAKALPGPESAGFDRAIADAQARKAALEAEIKPTQDLAKARGDAAEANRKMAAAEAVSREIRPIGPEIERLQEQASKLQAGYKEASAAAEKLLTTKPADDPEWWAATKRAAEYLGNLERVNRQLQEYREAEGAGSIEADKAARAQEIRNRYLNQFSVEAKAAEARELALNEARGSTLSQGERQAKADMEGLNALMAATRAREEAKRAANDNLASLSAETKAMTENGAAAAEMARLRAAAEVEARRTNESPDIAFERMRQQELARVNLELERLKTTNKELAATERAANAAAREHGQGEAQRAENLAKIKDLQAQRNKLVAAGVTDQAQLNAQMQDYGRSIDAANSAQAEAKALGMLADQRDSIDLLKLEVSLLGKSAEERTRALAALKAEQALRRQGIDANSDSGRQYVDGAKLEASLTATRDRFVDLSKDLGQIIGGVFDDLFTKTDKGFAGIADNALKSFSKLGSRLIEQQFVTPLLQGRGLGHLFPTNDNSDPKLVKEGTEAGVFSGFRKAFEDLGSFIFGGGSGKSLDISNGGAGSGLISMKGLGGLGMAGLAGFGMGQQSQNPIIGGIGGALSGFAAGATLGSLGGPIGAVIGGLAGLAGGIFGQQQAKKQRRQQMMQLIQQYQDEWAELKPQADVFTRQLAGETVGTLETSIRDANSEASRTANAASKAGDTAAVERINKALDAFNSRTVREFATGIDGMMASFANGTGPNSPFNQARAAMLALGENVTGFVADVAYAAGEFGASALAAQKAAAEFAIGSLKVAEPLSTVEQRLQEIRGAASGLQQVLIDLGYSAEAAALAVRDGTTAAIDQLRGRFDSDLLAKTNSARGLDYLNQARQLIDEVAQLREDAALLGAGGERVDDYFRAAAQEIVNSAQLTGAAFDAFIADFPAFAGSVRAYGRELNEVAQAAANATRRLQYQDRLFAALNDTTTLEGHLAAFDRQAQRDREAELKAGGDELLALEEAIAAERLKLVSNYYDEMVQREQQALQEARNFFDTFSRNLREFVDGLRAGSQSPLSPEARLAAAQSQYNAQLALAQGGNRDAANSLTKYASDLIDAARGFHASSAGFQAIFNQVTAQLTALPTQVSAEQYIVDAIKDSKVSVLASLSVLDTNGDGMISRLEAANSKLAGIFTEIDINGDGQISKLEAILADAGATRTALQAAINLGPQSTATALAGYFQQLDTSVNGLLDYGEFRSGLNGLASDAKLAQIFAELDTNGDGQLSRLELIKAATQDTSARTAEVVSLQGTANSLASSANALQNSAISIATSMNSLLSAISSLNSTQVSTLAALNAQFSLTSSLTIRGSSVNNNMVTALNKIAYNTAWIMLYTGSSGGFGDSNLGAYASGGWIRGPGSPTSDSVPIWASDGEFMVNAAAARRHSDLLEAINGGASVADIAALGRQQLSPFPVITAPAANQNDGSREIVAELRRLNARIAELERKLVEAEYGAAGMVAGEVAGVRQEQRRAAADARQDRNRPDRAGKRVA